LACSEKVWRQIIPRRFLIFRSYITIARWYNINNKAGYNIKYTQEQVEEIFKEKGCILLSQYKNVKDLLKYICKCGIKGEITFEKIRKQKHGCKYCTKISGYTHEEVCKYFKDHNCKLLSTYINIKSKLKYICECGNESEITFDSFKRGVRCCKCGLEKHHAKLRNNIEYVKQFFIDNNCTPLFDEYINGKTLLKYQCSCGSVAKIRFNDFRRGKRCNECSTERKLRSKYIKNNAPVSLQQKYLHKLFGGELNYPVGKSLLDIAFIDNKIYIEYDGSGHNLSVVLKAKTQKEFDEYEKRRKYALYRRKWKEIRIISRKDRLPSDEILTFIYNFALKILNDNNYIVFDIDNKIIKYKNNILQYNYGKLKRLRND
jgi:very-short-patch-repair endonuclease